MIIKNRKSIREIFSIELNCCFSFLAMTSLFTNLLSICLLTSIHIVYYLYKLNERKLATGQELHWFLRIFFI
ncbi:hypothetical protein LEP1GSC017_0782 [Leptospira meyeri serovar Hardjo str. Went 5]|nr:hypothetical protein LEP1GSC017_0782 [Leptospira meyeri serovar Hardjo str. Went 5]